MDWINVLKHKPEKGWKIWALHPNGKSILGFANESDIGICFIETQDGFFIMFITKWATYETIY